MTRIITTVLLLLTVALSAPQSAHGAAAGRTVGLASVSDSGAAEYTIPLWTPPGTNGMQPALALKYSSRGGRSPFGTGWSLSGLSAIYRCGTTWEDGTPRDVRNDALDRFCMDGKKLRLVSGTYGAAGAEYRSEIEDFARVRSFGTTGAGPTYFTVEMKDGRIYEYGNTAESRVFPVGQSTVRLWALNKIQDRSGNAMMFKYLIDSANGSYVIDNVIYTQNVAQGTPPHYTVQFSYQSVPATEVNWTYQANKLIKRVLRSHQIDINFDGLMKRRYLLSYEPSLSAPNPSRLLAVRECTGPFEADCFNQTGFTYQNPSSGLLPEIDTGIASLTYGLYPYERARFMDVNGDGIEDMVFPSVVGGSAPSYWYVAFANGAGSYNTPFSTGIATTEHERAVVIDYNADGLEDLLVPYSGNTWWVILGTTSGLAAPFDTGISAVNASLARVLDIDGDGLQDLMWVDQSLNPDRLYYRRRELSGTFSAATIIPTGTLEAILYLSEPAKRSMVRVPDFNGDGRGDYEMGGYVLEDADDQRYSVSDSFLCAGMAYSECGFVTGSLGGLVPNVQPQFGDFNGDGLTDVIFTRFNTTRVMFSTGTRATAELSLGADYGNKTTVFDWDGDGRDDILYLNGNTGTLHVRRSTGESFAVGFNTGVALAGDSFLTVSDVNGDGLPDLVYSSNGSIRVRLHAGVKADLMSHATDAFGVGAIFTYESISRNNHTREASTFPLQSYSAPLLVVSRITHTTGAATPPTYTQDFWYYGGKMHLQGRGFAGFSKRRMLDSRTSLRRYEEYEQSFPLTGQLRRQSVYQANDTTLVSRSDYTWQVATYGSGVEMRRLPWISRTDTYEYELGGMLNGQLIRTKREDNLLEPITGTIYDTTTTVTEATAANGIQAGATYSHRVYQPTAALLNDVSNWCIGRPQQIEATASHSQFAGAARTRTTGMTWDPVACRLTQETLEPGHSQLQVTRTFGYDSFGNVDSMTVTGIGMAARTTRINWGGEGRFPEEIINALSQTERLGWDAEQGVIASHTDPNGEQTTWSVDRFGRQISETRPDGTSTAWEYIDCTNYLCLNNQPGSFVIVERRLDQLGQEVSDSVAYLDQYDRPMRRLTKSLTGAYSRVDIEYDALGRVRRESAPCWHTSCAQYWTTYSYDMLNRMTGTQRPTSATDPSPQSTTVYHEGLTTRSIDALSKQSTHVRNAIGQLARSMDHDGYYQSFDYDGFGNVIRVTDSANNTLLSNTYNIRGMRTIQTDMDMGTWTYTPNALGEIVAQLDAKNQTTSFGYDMLGRLTSRTEAEGVSTFTFGTSATAHNIGRLVSISGPGYTEGYTYDAMGRTLRRTIMSDATYYIDYAYNSIGALDTLTYPTSTSGYRLKLQYNYENGALKRVRDFNAPNTIFWTANDTDARGAVTDETLGNGIQTVRGFDAVTGALEYIQSGVGGGSARQNSNYVWDAVGNLTQRTESNLGLTQDYQYDNLHRLGRWTVNGASPVDIAYNALGNITSRSGLGTYAYHATRRHLVTQAGSNTFGYDNNGNATTRNGSPITWYSYNMPRLITASGNNSSEFFYAPDRSRWKQVASYGGTSEQTIYIGGLIEKVTIGTVTSWKHYISGTNGFVAEHIRRSSGTNETVYLLKDHLGSVEMITNATGGIAARLAYGGQGPRRNGSTYGGTPSSADWTAITNTTRRGFTGHEMLDNLNLIHMNGRVYDSTVGRFLSADPYVQAPGMTQSFNRYSYALNNPLRFTDPSGFNWDDNYPGLPGLDICFLIGCYGNPNPPVRPPLPIPQPDRPSCGASNPSGMGHHGCIVPGNPGVTPTPTTPTPTTPTPTPTRPPYQPPVQTPDLRSRQPVQWPVDARVSGMSTVAGTSWWRSALDWLGTPLTDPFPRYVHLPYGGVLYSPDGREITWDEPLTRGELIGGAAGTLGAFGTLPRAASVLTRGATAASSTAFRILEQEGNVIIGSFNGAADEARVITELVRQGDTLILRGTHIEGAGTLREALSVARQFGRDQGVKRVIEGGRRSTGANPGHIPRPITVETGL